MFDNLPPGAEAPRRRAHAWRRILPGLALGALSLAACTMALGSWLHRAEVRAQEETLARSAETVAVGVEGKLAAALRALETLGGSQALDMRDLRVFREEARRLLEREPAWHTIALTEGSRQVLNLRHAPDAVLPDAAPNLAVTLAGRASVAELPDGRILLRVPVLDEGAVRGALAAVLEAPALGGAIAAATLPPGWAALLLDSEGRLLAGRPGADRPSAALGAALAAPGRPQALEDGATALARRLAETGWAVVVVAPPAGLPGATLFALGLAMAGAALSGAAGLALARRGLDRGEVAPKPHMAPAPPIAALPVEPPRQPSRRILIAEDVPASRMLLGTVLQRAGHDVVAVEDGAQALAALREGGFDLAVLDLVMPVMDGTEAAAEIRRLPGSAGRLPLVALTADAAGTVESACLAAGFDAVLRKPFESRRLVSLVEALRARRPEPVPQRGDAPG